MVNDTISDTLTRIRNAILAKHQIVQVSSTKITRNLIAVLKQEGFIEHFDETQDELKKLLLITLRYKGKNKQPIITKIKRISKPGLKVYAKHKELPKVLNGIGIAIISTSKGIMTDKQARYFGLGGEVLCYVW